MEWGFFWIYWGFGSWKTIGAVILITMKLSQWQIVFTNILLDRKYLPNPDNYFYFQDMADFYDILAFSWLFAMKVSEFSKTQVEKWLPAYPRGFRPKINVFFDEMGIFANAKDFKEIHKEFWKDLQQYVLQLRKLHVTCFLIIQRPKQLVSDLRVHVTGWLKFKPLWGWESLWKYAWSYYLQELDQDTFHVITEKKHAHDEKWNQYSYEVPQERVSFKVWWKPKYFKYYDDLFLNKIFDTESPFRWDYLWKSQFFDKLKQNNINNKALTFNKHIYEDYFKNSIDTNTAFQSPKVSFRDNSAYYLHFHYKRFLQFMSNKHYISNLPKVIFTAKPKKRNFKRSSINSSSIN